MSEVKTDKLTGVGTAGDITVTSEGGAVTMQLQQGLAKAWINFNGQNTPAARDSNNVSSITDAGTGQYFVTVSSSMASANFSVTAASQSWADVASLGGAGNAMSSSGTPVRLRDYAANYGDPTICTVTIHGDLA